MEIKRAMVFLGLLWFYLLLLKSKNSLACEYFSPNGFNPDFFEYHLPAANLALHHRFPVYGFLSDMKDYKLCANPESIKYYRDTYYAGTMIFPSKPPLYSFLTGTAYLLHGFRPQTAERLNMLFLIILGLSLAGSVYNMTRSWVFSLISLVVIFFLRKYQLNYYDAELLTACLVGCLCFLVTCSTVNYNSLIHAATGFASALLLLAKGYYLPVSVFLMAGYVIIIIKYKSVSTIRNALFYFVGLLIGWVPWIVFINKAVQNDIPNRLRFSKKLEETAPHLKLNSRNEIFDSSGKYREDVIEDILKFHQYQHARENDFILITNQLGEYNILNVHNEYCTDGEFHPEWRIIKTSYYNQLPENMNKHYKLL
ncbi:MAG: hypothetical protein NZ522_08090, partial [Chitinophagales bacterium]|nr:hypothetical protein [Chitinophagales bacterium]